MIRNTIAIAALLGSIDANSLTATTEQQEVKGLLDNVDVEESLEQPTNDGHGGHVSSDGEDVHDHNDGELSNLELADVEEDLDDNEQVQLGEASTLPKMAASCHDGVKRWAGPSNTWKTFKDAHNVGSGLYKDDTFRADATSLAPSDKVSKFSYVKGWARPSSLQKGSPSFWGPKGYPLPHGVRQGTLGDCWFLAAASAVAEVPARMKRVAWNDSYDNKGAFRFFFWVKNKWHGINIDDRLPTRKGSRGYETALTHSSTLGAWWMPLLEKAYAKLDGNYERIVGGMGYEGLRTLTGMPTTYVSLKRGKDSDNTYKLLKKLADKNYPMTTPCCNNGCYKGLVSMHAYTLLNVLELSNGEKLAHIRNPWSQGEWKGDWSDSSSKWNAALKKEAGYVNANDGQFFMPFKTYAETFWGTSVALYQEYAGYKVIDVEQSTKFTKYTVNNPVDQELYIVADSMNARNYPRSCRPDNNSWLIIQDSKGTTVRPSAFIGGRGLGMLGKVGEKLPKGDYTVFVCNNSYKKTGNPASKYSLNFYWADQAGTAAATA